MISRALYRLYIKTFESLMIWLEPKQLPSSRFLVGEEVHRSSLLKAFRIFPRGFDATIEIPSEA